MIKRVIGVAGMAAVLASPAYAAEFYVNPEVNVGAGLDSGVGSAIVEGHVGIDFDNGAYIQAGPALLIPDSGETGDVEISGKAGISNGPLYGEVSFITGDELSLGFKTGAKFSF
jgi:opacity protein-like surface antigen|tara:strand:- start:548 stop:889 length:342 start_codon:yes stop_codon:yes gene_type:complete